MRDSQIQHRLTIKSARAGGPACGEAAYDSVDRPGTCHLFRNSFLV